MRRPLLPLESVFDDVTGVQLPPEKVGLARRKDIEFLFGFPVYKCVDDAEADGHDIIGTRWVDVNKGDRENINVRSRLCAKELKWKNPWLEYTFVGTPNYVAPEIITNGLVWSETERRGSISLWIEKHQ